MRILALDHGSKRIGVAVSDETKTIAQPLEYILAEPFADFLARLKKILGEKEIDLILIGLPRNMDGSYGPAAQKVRDVRRRFENGHHRSDKIVGRAADEFAGEQDFNPRQRAPRQTQRESGQDGGGDFVAKLSGWNLTTKTQRHQVYEATESQSSQRKILLISYSVSSVSLWQKFFFSVPWCLGGL